MKVEDALEDLIKSKYIRRTGSSGNYVYTYKETKKRDPKEPLKLKKIKNGLYEYGGFSLKRDNDIATSDVGAWKIADLEFRTLKDAQEHIDKMKRKEDRARREKERKAKRETGEWESVVDKNKREKREREEARLKEADVRDEEERQGMGVDALRRNPVLTEEQKKARRKNWRRAQAVPMGQEDSIRNIPNLTYGGHVSKALEDLINKG